jgi:hypothetical protein
MLPGLRSLLAEIEGMAHSDSLLHRVPGWPFVDWVPEWDNGCGPGVREGDSSIVNLHWTLALLAAKEVEEGYGDPVLADRCGRLARRSLAAILARYWDEDRGLLLDTPGAGLASEHAQIFAVLTGLLDAQKTEACLGALRCGDGLAKATISASYYLLEALFLHRQEAEFHRRLDFWRKLPALGFTSTPEGPEPSRSDAHPAWHTLGSIAGIRPAAPAFAQVRIAPLVGPLLHFEATAAHPRGTIQLRYRRSSEAESHFVAVLPDGITGILEFGGETHRLAPGESAVISRNA